MWSVFTFFFSKYWLFVAVVAVAFSYIGFKEIESRMLKHEVATLTQNLADANATLASRAAVIAELERDAISQTHIRTVIQHVTETIEALPNANTRVPLDIATAWAAGVNGVWNDAGGGESGNIHNAPRLPGSSTPFS